jgi:hypothetical protein
MNNRMRHAVAAIRSGLLTLRVVGLRSFLQKLGHQLYSRNVFVGTVKRLDDPIRYPSFECTVAPASPQDLAELFSKIHSESRDGRYQLLVRKWYHERGFGDCYVTKVKDTGELCGARWVVTSKHIRDMGWEARFPGLSGEDVLIENVYVLEKFRRMGVQQSSFFHIAGICRESGFTNAKGWVAEDNIPELMACRKSDWLAFEKVVERHFLFRVTRNILERYVPPVPVQIP